MKKTITTIKIISLITLLILFPKASAYQELILRNIDGKPVRLIKVILDGEHFIVTSLASTWGDTLENLTKKVWWKTSLNGTFFCPDDYSYCNGTTHSNFERIYQGEAEKYSKYRPDTGIRWIFWFQRDGTPLLVNNNFGYMEGLDLSINKDKIYQFYFWLGNFPIILAYGEDILRWSEQEIDDKMKSKWNKHFICSTKDNTTIYMWAIWWINIYELPAYLKKNFDCYFALNLDAWYSSAMVYNGDVIERSNRRRIMDAFVVLTKDEYQKLNWYTPPAKTTYIQPIQYSLTTDDKIYIKNISKICHTFIERYGSDIKRKTISLFRKMLDAPKYQTAKDQKVIHEILINLYKIDDL